MDVQPKTEPAPRGARKRWWWVLLGLVVAGVAVGVLAQEGKPLDRRRVLAILARKGVPVPERWITRSLEVPPGFWVARFAEEVSNARFMRFTPNGDLLVTQPKHGRVSLLLPDADGDGRTDGVRTLVEGLNQPHGLDLRDGWLYVAETDAIGRVRFDPDARAVNGGFERIVTGLPGGGSHWTRTLRFGPDGWMYLSLGSSCNICIEEDPRRATILRYRPDGTEGEIHAAGLRNSVGFDWQPGTGELYATDNGRDRLGDDFPPCELNRIVKGSFYGWPFANGNRIIDPDHGAGKEARVASSVPPVFSFRAHNAPLGITFLRSNRFPADYHSAAVVALHGSWNRTNKDGYKVVSLHWGPDGTIQSRDFLWGFLQGEYVTGRPVDVAEGPDGSVYVSDDHLGLIYRVAHGEPPAAVLKRAVAKPAAPASGTAPAEVARLTPEEKATRVARGRTLYDSLRCASCHESAQAAPGVVVKPLQGLAGRHSLASLEASLRTPTPPMPVFEMSDEDRRDLAIFLAATYP